MLSNSGDLEVRNISAAFATIKRKLNVEVHTQIVMA